MTTYNITVHYKGCVTYCLQAASEAEAEQLAEDFFADGIDSHAPASDFEEATGVISREMRMASKTKEDDTILVSLPAFQ